MTRSLDSGREAAGGVIKVTRGVSGQNHERKQFRMGIRSGGSWLRPTLVMFFMMSCAIGRSYALDIAYCSSDNTGSSSTPMTDTFQSNGLCHDYCIANYAFAVVQGSKCWCSNYIPSTQATGCTEKCPGYGLEQCGNTSKGLFGYIALTNSPSGTSGPSSTVRSTSSPPQTSSSSSPPIDTTSTSTPPSISTVVEPGPTKTLIITATPTSTTSSTSTSTSTTTSSTTSTTSTTTSTDTPNITIITSGGVRTVTYTPESTASATATPVADTNSGNFFSQPGRVAGLFVGIALIIIAFVAGLLFFCYRRNRRRGAMHGGAEAGGIIPAGGAGIMAGRRRSRSLSTLGLIGEKGFHSVNTTPASGPPNMAGLNGVANSVARGPDGTKLVDQRLDPNQLYLRYDPDTGSSRMSVRSLRDDADYSRRVLRLANPDD